MFSQETIFSLCWSCQAKCFTYLGNALTILCPAQFTDQITSFFATQRIRLGRLGASGVDLVVKMYEINLYLSVELTKHSILSKVEITPISYDSKKLIFQNPEQKTQKCNTLPDMTQQNLLPVHNPLFKPKICFTIQKYFGLNGTFPNLQITQPFPLPKSHRLLVLDWVARGPIRPNEV